MRRSTYFALFLTLAAASAATAQAPLASSSPVPGILRMTGFGGVESEEAQKARAFQKLRVSGMTLSRVVKKLRKLKWHSSLQNAKKAARLHSKPILWIQALGNLKSYT